MYTCYLFNIGATDHFDEFTLDSLRHFTWPSDTYIKVQEGKVVRAILRDKDDYESFLIGLERAAAWKPLKVEPSVRFIDDPKQCTDALMRETGAGGPKKDFVSPSHYKDYIAQMQWLDAMSHIPTLRAPVKFKAAVEMQVRKYLDRNGSKDEELQELRKSRFYLCYLVAYIENDCKPIRAEDVHAMLTGSADLKRQLEESHEAFFQLEKAYKELLSSLQERPVSECQQKVIRLEDANATLRALNKTQADSIQALFNENKKMHEISVELDATNIELAALKFELSELKSLKGARR